MVKFTKYDKYPFVITLGVLPVLAFLIYIRHAIMIQLDDMLLMQIFFVAALGAIGFTWACKFLEDRRTAQLRKLRGKLEKLLIKQKSTKNLLEKTKKEIKTLKEKSSTLDVEQQLELLKKAETALEEEDNGIAAELETTRNNIADEKIKLHSESITTIQNRLNKSLEQAKNELNNIMAQAKSRYTNDEKIKELTSKLNKTQETKLGEGIRELIENLTSDKDNKITELKNKLKSVLEKNTKAQTKALKELDIYDEPEEEKPEHSRNNQLLIFAALYAIIGGLAITASVEAFVDPDQNPNIPYAHNIHGFVDLITSKPALVIASFFPIAIMFIHCGIIFLSSDAVDVIAKGNRFGVFISSLLIFLQSIVLFYAGTSINDILNFSFWVLMLALIDIAWVVANLSAGIDEGPQWLHLDLILVSFLVSILFLFPSLSQVRIEVYVYVLVLFLLVTIADYVMGWKSFWGAFNVSDSPL